MFYAYIENNSLAFDITGSLFLICWQKKKGVGRTPPEHVLDPTHVPVLSERPLGFGTVQKRIPTFGEEGDNIFEVPSMDTSVIRNDPSAIYT